MLLALEKARQAYDERLAIGSSPPRMAAEALLSA